MNARGGSIAAFTVIALSALYITLLTSIMSLLMAGIVTTPFGRGDAAELVFGILGVSFLIVALIVATVVVTNAFALVTASRLREIALRRLLGASAKLERRRIARAGLRMAIMGTVAGVVVAIAAALLIFSIGSGAEGMLAAAEPTDLVNPWVVVPLLALIGCTVLAAWRGSTAVLAAQPVHALGMAGTQESGGVDESTRLRAGAAVTLIAGLALIALTAIAGAFTPFAALLGIIAGTVLVIGVLAGARALMPRVFSMLAAALPTVGPPAIARRTLREHPGRTTRAALGVLISVAVVSMFVVATASANTSIAAEYRDTALADEANDVLFVVLAVISALIGFIVLISAVGLATTVALNTRLRSREIAITRILGQGRRDAAQTVLIEGAVLSLGAALAGLALGALLGWAGAQSIIGSVLTTGVVTPVIPLWFAGIVAAAAIVLTIVSSVAPIRFVLADSPVRAFARA